MNERKSISAIIVDDEKKSRESLALILQEFCPEVKVAGTASSVDEALELIDQTDPELVFLDIQMNSETGFDLLKQFKAVSFEVIFTTAYAEYAIEAIRFSALDYLLKPIDVEELRQAVKKARKRKNDMLTQDNLENLIENFKNAHSDSLKIALPTFEGLVFVNIKEILYLQADGSYTNIFVEDGKKYCVTKVLKEYEHMLASKNFFRIHNSYIINLDKIERYLKGEGGSVVMKNGDILDVSKRKKQAFMTKIGL